jgi:hypothetical protein
VRKTDSYVGWSESKPAPRAGTSSLTVSVRKESGVVPDVRSALMTGPWGNKPNAGGREKALFPRSENKGAEEHIYFKVSLKIYFKVLLQK